MNNVCNLVIFKSCLSSTSFHFKGLRIRDVVAVLRRPRAADTVLLSSLGDETSSQRSSLRSARGRRVCVFTRFAGNEIKKKDRTTKKLNRNTRNAVGDGELLTLENRTDTTAAS